MERKEPRRISGKLLVALLAVVLAIGCAVGGTVAWLVTSTATVTNTFTYGNINIKLDESTGSDYKIIPGVNIKKDPYVEVTKGSEPCWLFVEVEQTGEFLNAVTFTVDNTVWTPLTGHAGVYYREVGTDADNAQTFYILTDNTITVSDTLTKAQIDALTDDNKTPLLKFTAYAVQKAGIDTVEKAWEKAN